MYRTELFLFNVLSGPRVPQLLKIGNDLDRILSFTLVHLNVYLGGRFNKTAGGPLGICCCYRPLHVNIQPFNTNFIN